jgi:PAS domain S-box-containing protein
MVLIGYGAAFLLLQLAARSLGPGDPALLLQAPAGLSLALLLIFGPRVLPAVLLAPLPGGLLLAPPGLGLLAVFGLAAAQGGAQALAAWVFHRAGWSPRLRRTRDAAGFIATVVLASLLTILPTFLLLQPLGAVPSGQLLRSLALGGALAMLAGTPVLLLWARPLVTVGWRGDGLRVLPQPQGRALLQVGCLCLAAVVVARYSQPGTLHLKYLLFLPVFWMVLQGGLRMAALGLPLLCLVLALATFGGGPPPEAILGVQSFGVMLFSAALYVGAAVDTHETARAAHDRASLRLGQLLVSTGAIPWEMELDTGRCSHLGDSGEVLLGWPQEAWKGSPFWGEVVHPEDQAAFRRFLLDASQPRANQQLEFRLRAPGGGVRWVRVAGGPDAGQPGTRVVGFLFDIHAQKRAEEDALHASLRSKDLLLREIHHRVKNNLQVVSSLLRLQASTQQDPALQRALQEAQERVQAIALVHQKLKHAPDLSRLDLRGYVQTLAERLVRSHASVPALIDLQVRVAEVALGPDAPVPLGLILNELLANALQHAFPPGEGGSLEVDIDMDHRGWIALRVADSGCGLPEAVDLDHGNLGFQLVRALTDQLGGVLELERRRGASFLLSFPPARHP